ncbi:F0F1 ATP synthase subunit alpha [Mangrovimicrobium sediminis]|uniref:ATP synthase subunit alpha n=1 Tax=Mangrovimicrobium sediminis TaxID=2562682 RepID=A0A4Z0LZD0_9GAMM|nr:F0F1 ATP synthase subunit alpha [Haliea sp. SAOS-164]TGD72584.1 F0F1 ATP synthase subunit alpha [Haliea sp. SAOS-164]
MNGDERITRQREWLAQYDPQLRLAEHGTVVSVGDGIVWINGLPSAAMDDIIALADGSRAMVFDLQEGVVGAVLLQETEQLTSGTAAQLTGHTLSLPVGDGLLGRIINPLGDPLDDLEPAATETWQAMEAPSPTIIERDFVTQPLYTGIKIVDSMIPIGRGQRQLVIGDEGLGRSSLAMDTVINQHGKDVQCIYVLIGQKRSAAVQTITTLREFDALAYTTVVLAEANTLPGLQHLAPFAGCALGEFWMRRGRDVLIVYDDLSTHARTYRELSLLLGRPPGREAYPGDIFSVHARLLERGTRLNAAHGGGSMTALAIVETNLGEIAAYIPTNLISITDGQIYLDKNLFTSGFRPAIDISVSVSRIGGQAQHPCIKREAGRMKLDYLQYLELEVFTRFGTRLEASMEKAIHRGRLLRELLKQDRLSPLPARFQLAWMVAFNAGLLDTAQPADVPGLLQAIGAGLESSQLDLDAERDAWLQALRSWLQAVEPEPAGDSTAGRAGETAQDSHDVAPA